MTIADGMHQIVDNINGARMARASDIKAIRVGVQKDLKQINRTRRHDATAQKKTLHRFVKTLRHDSEDMLGGFSASRMAMGQECRKELGDFTDQLTKDVSNIRIDNRDFIHQLEKDITDIRIDTVHMIHGFTDERVSRDIEISRMLKSYNDGIVEDVQHLMGMFRQERIPVQEDLAEAHAIWQSHVSGGHVPTKAPKRTVAKAAEVTKTPEKKEDTTLKGKILKVIKASPKGITLAKAGKKIDVEWRTLIKPAKELVEAGLVAKKETQYFPS